MKMDNNSFFEKIKKYNKLVIFLILITGNVLLFSAVNYYGGDYLTWKSYDFLVKKIGGKEVKPHKDVMLLLIDENSLRYGEEIGAGRWPWSRNIYPEILSFINRTDPPKGIFFDIFFLESDLGEGNDAAFSSEIYNSGNIFQNIILEENIERKKAISLPPDITNHFTVNVESPENIKYLKNTANEYSVPIPCLRSEVDCGTSNSKIKNADPIAQGFSVAVFNADKDGVYRRGRVLFNYQEHFFPSMSLSAILAYTGEKKVKILPDNVIQAGKYKIPVDSDGKYLANYYKGGNRIPAYSMSALLLSAYFLNNDQEEKMTIRPEDFKDKIVIIGCSAPGCQDRKNTPISKVMPGPEIHATIISNILQQNHVVSEEKALTYIILVFIILGCVASVLFVPSNLFKIIILASIIILYTGINIWLFNSNNYLSPIIFILIGALISSASSFIYLSMTEGAEKRKYSKILGNMIDPHIVSEALKDLDALKTGGEKNITAFFSDIASFSTISEKLSSSSLAALLNEYLSAMTDILKTHGGTLDKYIGDAIVGIFGAPMENPDNAIKAARASLEMDKKLAQLREKWITNNEYCEEARQMRVRIGLNTGVAKVGFMGTENLASYTMMGDTVNLAARLEAAGKDYGVSIMVSEMTKSLIHKEMELRLLDAVRVKGKTEPVHIYELVSQNNDVSNDILESIKLYEEAFQLYEKMLWDEAIIKFKASAKARGNLDKSTKLLINRCLLYKKAPPPDDWDGVFTRTTK